MCTRRLKLNQKELSLDCIKRRKLKLLIKSIINKKPNSNNNPLFKTFEGNVSIINFSFILRVAIFSFKLKAIVNIFNKILHKHFIKNIEHNSRH